MLRKNIGKYRNIRDLIWYLNYLMTYDYMYYYVIMTRDYSKVVSKKKTPDGNYILAAERITNSNKEYTHMEIRTKKKNHFPRQPKSLNENM